MDRATDCGAASLYIVCKLAGREVPLAQLRTMTKTSAMGTSMFNLKEAAELLGFEVEACRCPFNALRKHVSRPHRYAILYLEIGHFVAVVQPIGTDAVRVLETSSGILELSERAFRDQYLWKGSCLLITDSRQD